MFAAYLRFLALELASRHLEREAVVNLGSGQRLYNSIGNNIYLNKNALTWTQFGILQRPSLHDLILVQSFW